MKVRVMFESPRRAVVVAEPSWLERLLGFRPYERFAELSGWRREWRWVEGDRVVPMRVLEAIERELAVYTTTSNVVARALAAYDDN